MQPETHIPSVSVRYAQDGSSTRSNSLGMRPMQERAYQKRGEQYLLIKSPPASGKSRALMFIALDKLENQGVKQAIIVVPERSIGASFHDEPLSRFGFWADWKVEPKWNLCDAPSSENGGKVEAVRQFLGSEDKALVCTHATFRFAMEKFGAEAFDDRLIAVDEFHHVSANPDNRLGDHVRQLMARDKAHLVAMTGSYFRGDAEAVLHPDDESRFDTVTYTYYEQLNGYQYDNGTEGDLLLRSFQRALYKDKTSRRITTPDHGPLFSRNENEGDSHSGFIYVLRSRSEHPFIAANREVIHKIGVTGGDVNRRIANAGKDPTFLLADVEIVGTYKLANLDRNRLERLIHRFFSPARLDLELKDRFGQGVEPQEWFLVPFPVIEEAVQRMTDGSIDKYRYDPAGAAIVWNGPGAAG